MQTIGDCIENICLSATCFGLGSLWVCDIDCCFSEVQGILSKPNVALGCALKSPKTRPRLEVNK